MVSALILIGIGILCACLAIPMARGKIKRNECYGFRTELTLSSDEVWFAANRYAGKLMIAWGAFAVIAGLLALPFSPPPLALEIALMMIPFTILTPCILAMRWTKRHFGNGEKDRDS